MVRDFGLAVSNGAISLINLYNAVDTLMDCASTRAMVLQQELSRAPEITEQIYRGAEELARNMSGGDYFIGLMCAGIAGVTGALSLYCIFGKDEEESPKKQQKPLEESVGDNVC